MYCGKCGSEIREGSLFCPNCGNKVNQINADLHKQNEKANSKNKTKAKKIIKKVIITVLVLSLVISAIGTGVNFYLKLNGHTTYECTYEGIERVSKSICRNISHGKAEIEEIKSFSDGDYRVYFNVYLSGKQEETIEVNFYNYSDSNMIGTILIDMRTDSMTFNKENTYNCCIAVASAVEKTFLAWRYVDEYADYSYVMQEISKLNWGSDEVVLHSYVISDGPEVIISVDELEWDYKLEMM